MSSNWTYHDNTFSMRPFIEDVVKGKITKSDYKKAEKVVLELGLKTYVGTIAPIKKQEDLKGIILRVTQDFGNVEQYGFSIDETGVIGAFQGVIGLEKFDITQFFLRNADRIHKELRWEGDPQKILGGLYVKGEISSASKKIYTFELVQLQPDMAKSLAYFIKHPFNDNGT